MGGDVIVDGCEKAEEGEAAFGEGAWAQALEDGEGAFGEGGGFGEFFRGSPELFFFGGHCVNFCCGRGDKLGSRASRLKGYSNSPTASFDRLR